MKLIVEARKDILALWRKTNTYGARYRLIQYVVQEGRLLHNTVTGEVIELNDTEYALLSTLPAPYSSQMDELILHHYLVEEETNEKQIVDHMRIALKAAKKSHDITHYTILPTSSCNARCFYCYEYGYPQASMSQETADQTVKYIVKHCNGKKVRLSWFGGEPLLGKQRISQICSQLQSEEIEYVSNMTSNGLLFTDELIREAKKTWNLKRVQITLDGTEKIYNQVKAYANPIGSPFLTVLDNIDGLLQNQINVNIRMNLDKHNINDLEQLIDVLSDRFANREGIHAYVAILLENVGESPIARSKIDRDLLEEKRLVLIKHLVEKGLRKPGGGLSSLRINQCEADDPQSIVINPNGQIGKCQHFTFDKLIGCIRYEETDASMVDYWKEIHLQQSECIQCPFYPSCVNLKHCEDSILCTKTTIETGIKNCRVSMRVAAEQHTVIPRTIKFGRL